MYEVVLTRQAKEDIVDIGDYVGYTLMEPETAYGFVKGLRKSIMTLKEMPHRYGKIVDEVLSSQGIHCMPYKNYYVFYEIIEMRNLVIVLRIGYNRRNWREILL
jgi:toxin ParE1/3/4